MISSNSRALVTVVQFRGGLHWRDHPVPPGRQTLGERWGCVRQSGGSWEGHGQTQAEHAEQVHRAVLRGSLLRAGERISSYFIIMIVMKTINAGLPPLIVVSWYWLVLSSTLKGWRRRPGPLSARRRTVLPCFVILRSRALRDSSTLFAPLASHFVESAIVRIYWIVFITAGAGLAGPWWW